jgi:hypothetical protein
MKHLNIPIPEDRIDELARAMSGITEPCPRHGDKCQKMLVVIDTCQFQLLKLLELIMHGETNIEIAEGRPTNIHHCIDVGDLRVRQDVKLGKDDVEKVGRLLSFVKRDGNALKT